MQNSYVWQYGLAMFISGTIGFFAHYAGLDAFSLVFYRCVIAAMFLGLYAWGSGQLKKSNWQPKELVRILITGVALVFNWVALFKAFGL